MLALKNSCPEIFHCIEIFFIIQDFWGTFACLENRVCPEICLLRLYSHLYMLQQIFTHCLPTIICVIYVDVAYVVYVIIIIVSRAQRLSARCALSQPYSQEPAIYHGPARGVQLRLGRGRAGQDRV